MTTEERLYVKAWPSRALLLETAKRLDTTPEKLARSLGLRVQVVKAIADGTYSRIHFATADRIATLKVLE
jgi:hypothetical protein